MLRPVIALRAMSKRYGRGNWILRDVAFEIAAGEVVKVHGTNGSGKSTLLRILAGISLPTEGRYEGRPDIVGYVPEKFPANERISALSYLTHLGRVRGMKTDEASQRAHGLLQRFSFTGGEKAPLRTLSKGNAQKVALTQAFLVRPRLLILDEPWSGLDRSSRRVLFDLIEETTEHSGAVVFTDHHETNTYTTVSRAYQVEQGRVFLREPDHPAVSFLPKEGEERDSMGTTLVKLRKNSDAYGEKDWNSVVKAIRVQENGQVYSVAMPHEEVDKFLLFSLRRGWSVESVCPQGRGSRVEDQVEELQ